MSRGGIFGWDLPPGCTMRMIDEQAGVYARCEICYKYLDDCNCECPTCGNFGDIICCYTHGMVVPQHVTANAYRLYREEQEQWEKEAERYDREGRN